MGSFVLEGNREQLCEIELYPEMDGPSGRVSLQLTLPDAAVPADHGISPDPRMLGIALTKITFRSSALLPE